MAETFQVKYMHLNVMLSRKFSLERYDLQQTTSRLDVCTSYHLYIIEDLKTCVLNFKFCGMFWNYASQCFFG